MRQSDFGPLHLLGLLIGIGIPLAAILIRRPTKGVFTPDWRYKLVARRFFLNGAPTDVVDIDLPLLRLWPLREAAVEAVVLTPEKAVRRVLPIVYGPTSDRYRQELARLHFPAPAGTAMRADETGLRIGDGEVRPWSTLLIDAVHLESLALPSTGRSFSILTLEIAAPDAGIRLDRDACSNGRAFVDNVCRRLMAEGKEHSLAEPPA